MRNRSVAVTLALAALLSQAACEILPGRPEYDERPRLATEIDDLATLYARNCAACHGADGRRGAARPMNDPVYLALVDQQTLASIIRDGVPGTAMPGFAPGVSGGLTDEQITILARDMRKEWGDPRVSVGGFPPYRATGAGDAARGAATYATFCARCHGEKGTGGKDGGSVVDPAYLALVSDQSLRTTVLAGRPDLGMPDASRLVEGKPMSAAEVADVVAWLVSHRRPFPGQPFPEPANARATPPNDPQEQIDG